MTSLAPPPPATGTRQDTAVAVFLPGHPFSRAELHAFAEANGMSQRLSIPADDEVLEL